jgi:hypothetical protein
MVLFIFFLSFYHETDESLIETSDHNSRHKVRFATENNEIGMVETDHLPSSLLNTPPSSLLTSVEAADVFNNLPPSGLYFDLLLFSWFIS